MDQAFKISHYGTHGPWPDKEAYHCFSLVVLDPRFPKEGLDLQQNWIKDIFSFNIAPECSQVVHVSYPEFIQSIDKFTVGIYVYDHEIATMIKLAYS